MKPYNCNLVIMSLITTGFSTYALSVSSRFNSAGGTLYLSVSPLIISTILGLYIFTLETFTEIG